MFTLKLLRPRFWATACMVLALLAMLGWWIWGVGPSKPAHEGVRLAPGVFAKSLEGTVPNGGLPAIGAYANRYADAFKDGMPYAHLRRFFDYYLSTHGEKDDAAITAQIHAEIDQYLPPELAHKVRALFGKYLAFKNAEEPAQDLSQLSVADAARARFRVMQGMRERHFDAQEVNGLFGQDIAYEQRQLDRMDVNNNPNYTAAQKAERLAAIDAALPPEMRELLTASTAVITTQEAVEKLRAQGGSESEVFDLRAKAFSPQAATRLAAVDQEEAAWKVRIAAYREQRDRILARKLPASEQQAQLTQLQTSNFNSQEILRLIAYE